MTSEQIGVLCPRCNRTNLIRERTLKLDKYTRHYIRCSHCKTYYRLKISCDLVVLTDKQVTKLMQDLMTAKERGLT